MSSENVTPLTTTPNRAFSVTNLIELIADVEAAINTFNQTTDDIRRDLAIHILTTLRGD